MRGQYFFGRGNFELDCSAVAGHTGQRGLRKMVISDRGVNIEMISTYVSLRPAGLLTVMDFIHADTKCSACVRIPTSVHGITKACVRRQKRV